MYNAFNLPRMKITERYDYDKEEMLKELIDTPVFFTFYKTAGEETRFLFTGFGEEESKVFIDLICRHKVLYEFVRASLTYVDRLRSLPLEEQAAIMSKVEYIQVHNQSKS